ncbi:MAG: peptide deformylase [Flavobacteriales bacterium]|nr:peptide deformylase [Flavobacteriales bacterium]
MILPIRAYGDPILKKKCKNIELDYPGLEELLANMYETMYNASGVGLAAPQIGQELRIFIVDGEAYEKDEAWLSDFRGAFINPEMIVEEGELKDFNEGCLSIPNINEDITRKSLITIKYYDENLDLKQEDFHGIAARIIQHEYDHIEGKLFTDHLNPLKRRMLKRKLALISQGITDVKYKMKYPIRR